MQLRRVVGEPIDAVGSSHLRIKLFDTADAAATHRLVGARGQSHEIGRVVQRLQDGHRRHRRAIGVGDDALLGQRDVLRVDFRYHEGHFWVHAPARRIVDDDCASSGELRREGARGGGAGREDGDVEARWIGGGGVFDEYLAAGEFELAAGRAGGCKKAQFVVRKVTLSEERAHHVADHAGRADDADVGFSRRCHSVRLTVREATNGWDARVAPPTFARPEPTPSRGDAANARW